MTQFKSQNYSICNLNFRVSGAHARLVHAAAALHKESASAYMRRVILEWSAAELKQDPPDLSEYTGDIISNAAKQMGVSVAEFMKIAARESAARVLQSGDVSKISAELQARLAGPRPASEPPPSVSSTRRRKVG